MTHHSAEWEQHPAPTLPLSSLENDRQEEQVAAPFTSDSAVPLDLFPHTQQETGVDACETPSFSP